ncbi:hypothetical protein OS122_04995 [Mycolicibacterium mucogenicum]|nr:hypothetical protein [Mycolicibacterium mucogenicum]
MFRRSISGTVGYTSRSDRLHATCDTLEITCRSGILTTGAQPRADSQQNIILARLQRQPGKPDQNIKISNSGHPNAHAAGYSAPPKKTETVRQQPIQVQRPAFWPSQTWPASAAAAAAEAADSEAAAAEAEAAAEAYAAEPCGLPSELPGLPAVAYAASQLSDSKIWLVLEPPLLAGAETVRATWLVTTQFGHWSWSPTVVETNGLNPALDSADRASLNFCPTTLGGEPADATPLLINATALSEVAAATPHAVFMAPYPALTPGAALIVDAVDAAGDQVWVAPLLKSGT